jgi:uncharacterized protein YcfJ
MNHKIRIALGVAGLALAAQAGAQVTFYSGDGFRGRTFTADRQYGDLERQGFNDRASSAIVNGGTWQVCEDARFNGRCVILQPGQYDSLAAMGLDNSVSSVRPAETYGSYDNRAPRVAQYDQGQAPRVEQGYEYRRRADERVFEAPVTSVRAIVGPPEQRCWVERENVSNGGGGANVPGAVVGGIIGGILGHQVGAGRGRDVATVGGAVAGAAIGGNVNRDNGGTYSRDVQRCANVASNERVDYYDVTYNFRGVEHHVQMQQPPGPSLMVNPDGEPRI